MRENHIIPLNGLEPGKKTFSWHLDKEFFGDFENSEILDARVDALAEAWKSGDGWRVDCSLKGTVTVACDRCLEDLPMKIDTVARMNVKFGDAEPEQTEEDGIETIMLPESDTDLDMGQIMYDYVCLSIPMQRVHPEGRCNPEILKYLDRGTESLEEGDKDNPFSSLKDLLKEK